MSSNEEGSAGGGSDEQSNSAPSLSEEVKDTEDMEAIIASVLCQMNFQFHGAKYCKPNTKDWLTALQADSTLASYNTDCLLHIFNRLPLVDALHVGKTCRRLYYHFEESQKTTKALVLTRGKPLGLAKQKTFFLRNINSDAVEEEYPAKLIPFMLSFACNRKGKPFLAFTRKFVDTFVNLRYLEVSTRLNGAQFAELLTQLSASLPLLTSLKLYPEFYDFHNFRVTAKDASENFWHPLYHLKHPALRHLTLNILNRFNELYELTVASQLPILQQLTSFTFFSDQSLPTLYTLIQEFMRPPVGAHLTPGEGARFGLRLFKDKPPVKVLSMVPNLLAYFTYLDVQIGWCNKEYIPFQAALKSLFLCMAHMSHLQKVELTIGRDGETLYDYPAFLRALSKLEHLRLLSVDCSKNPKFGDGSRAWLRTDMPVLPSVRVFSLTITSANHADVVEQFHLVHCFSGMRRLVCHFKQDFVCIHRERFFDIWEGRFPQYQACGRELTRGLMELPAEKVVEKEIQFTFGGTHFSSLEKLLAGTKD